MRASKSRSTGAASKGRTIPTIPHISDIRGRRASHYPDGFLTGLLDLPFLVLVSLFQQDEADGHENKVEDQKLRALAIGRADVALKNGISNRQHTDENQNRQHLTKTILDGD